MTEETQEKDMLTSEETRLYEVAFHVVPLVGDEGLVKEVDAVRVAIEKAGGTIISEQTPQALTLAYPMQKDIARKRHTFDRAYFGWIYVECAPEGALAIKSALDDNEHILRFLIVKTEKDAMRLEPLAIADQKDAVSSDDETETDDADTDDNEETEDKEPMSEEEMDAEIDKLVADEA